jgi:hypothetical protein
MLDFFNQREWLAMCRACCRPLQHICGNTRAVHVLAWRQGSRFAAKDMRGRLAPGISLRHLRLNRMHFAPVARPRPKPRVRSRILDCQTSLHRPH